MKTYYTLTMSKHEYKLLADTFGDAVGTRGLRRLAEDVSDRPGMFKHLKTFGFKRKYERDQTLINLLRLLVSVWDRPGECPILGS